MSVHLCRSLLSVKYFVTVTLSCRARPAIFTDKLYIRHSRLTCRYMYSTGEYRLLYPNGPKQQKNMAMFDAPCGVYIYIFHIQVFTASHLQNVIHVFALGPNVTIGVSLQLCCAWRLELISYGKNWLNYVHI